MEEVCDLYCSQTPGGDPDALASLMGAVMSSIFIYSLWSKAAYDLNSDPPAGS